MMMTIEPRSALKWFAFLWLAGMLPQAGADDSAGKSPKAADEEVDGATLGRFGEPAAVNPETFKFSDAETRLWLSDHLKNITRPVRLYYQFVKGGSLEDGFSDSVFLDVQKLNADGTKNANLQFFTGEREQPYTPDNVNNIKGNPILGIYLRGDAFDMSRLTQGNWRYFQRRIKAAFSEGAIIEPITVTFEGKSIPAERISITPYINDSHRAQFEQLSGKRYEFVMSDQIPGTLYEIHTIVPGATAKDKPVLEERLTLQKAEFGK